ncbi:MAG: NAD(P)-dependent alcohol dehydrogenase [Chloroflexi bacterium]|nr:NAD(P)-dependent alcohol dehydrogenase [Chloroflexota bacterium]
MKAIVQDRYGPPEDVLELKDIEAPVVKDDEVLVCVHAASVHADVWHVVTGLPYVLRIMGAGLRKPKNPVPGTDVAGVVESVGRKVTRFQPGDEVFGETIKGMQWTNGGAYAEYATAPEDVLALKPPNVTFEQAAAVPTSALIALGSLKGEGKIQAGQKILVNGAGGGVGSFAVQLAKALGAEVTGVDSTNKLDMVRSIGADHVIDYTQEDFTRRSERYDLIFDIPGNHSFADCKRVLVPSGTYVLIGHDNYGKGMRRWVGVLPRIFRLMAMSPFVKQLHYVPLSRPGRAESMAFLKELLESGKLKPHIDRTYPLSEVPKAIRYLQEGQVKGKVVITV